MLTGSHKPEPIRNKQNPVCSFFLSKFAERSPDKRHLSAPLPREGFLPPETRETSHLWESGVWQKGRVGCCCLGFVFKYCPSALCSWILAFAGEVPRGFVDLNSSGIVLLLQKPGCLSLGALEWGTGGGGLVSEGFLTQFLVSAAILLLNLFRSCEW